MITLVARKEKGRLICENIGSVLHGTDDFILHVVFILSLVPGFNNLEGHIFSLGCHGPATRWISRHGQVYALCGMFY